jgi:hypothetical protein
MQLVTSFVSAHTKPLGAKFVPSCPFPSSFRTGAGPKTWSGYQPPSVNSLSRRRSNTGKHAYYVRTWYDQVCIVVISAWSAAQKGGTLCGVCVFITRACKLKKNRASAKFSLSKLLSLESPYGPNLWSSLSCVCSGPSPFPFPFPCSCAALPTPQAPVMRWPESSRALLVG